MGGPGASLFVSGALASSVGHVWCHSGKNVVSFVVFVEILSAITIANMLIGVICEAVRRGWAEHFQALPCQVITAVAAAEKEAIQITFVKDTLLRVMGRALLQLCDRTIAAPSRAPLRFGCQHRWKAPEK